MIIVCTPHPEFRSEPIGSPSPQKKKLGTALLAIATTLILGVLDQTELLSHCYVLRAGSGE